MVCFIDVHCHLDFDSLYSSLDNVIMEAKSAGVGIILTNWIDARTNRLSLCIAEKHSIVKSALGIYPPVGHFAENELIKELDFIRSKRKNIFAVGEIGMDFKNAHDKKVQENVFVSQLGLAEDIGKPVVIHSREAEKEVIDIMEKMKQGKVLLHCFHGRKSLIGKGIKLGFYFSISTNVVRSEHTQMLASLVPLNRIFAETDAPFMSPFKEKGNRPAFVVESYKKIAEIKGITIEEARNHIYMNWQRLFQ